MKSPRSVPKQSDIVIDPEGKVAVSFLWDDYQDHLPHTSVTTLQRPFILEKEEEFSFDYSQCEMCPKKCGFNRVKAMHPRCGGAALQIGTWGRTYGDEKEIVGSGGSGAILFSHCPLTCPSCHNPEMVRGGHKVSLNELIDICYTLYEEGAENIQFLSPTVHMAKLETVLQILKKHAFPLPIVFKSSGVENIDYLRRFVGLIDIYLPDFKYGPDSLFAHRAGVPHYFLQAQETILEMIRQVGPPKRNQHKLLTRGVLIRHVKAPIPEAERQAILTFLHSLNGQCVISITDNFVNLE